MSDQLKDVVEKLKAIKAKKVFIQFPEGLTLKIQEIVNELERRGFEVVTCVERCFGACDIRDTEAMIVGCDTILHIGHEPFIAKTKLPVVYWEYFIDVDPVPALQREIKKLEGFNNIGLITSIQFVNSVPVVKKFLEMNGKKVFVHKSLQYLGQVLGCSLEAAKAVENKVDCFLCISAGEFYADGVVMITEKSVFNLDLERKEIYSLENFKRKVQKIIAWNRAKLEDAKRVGILVSWKRGQMSGNPFEIKEKLEKEGKEAYILAMDEIVPEKLEGLKLDALISLACPRIGIDDLERYKTPIVNVNQLKE